MTRESCAEAEGQDGKDAEDALNASYPTYYQNNRGRFHECPPCFRNASARPACAF